MSGDLNTSSNDGATEMPPLSRSIVGIQSTALLLLLVSSLICNTLVGYVLLKKPEVLSHSSSKLLLNLSASSLLFSLTVLPFVFASSVKKRWIFGDDWCQASGFLTVLFSSTSLEMVMFLSIDRYHCIVNPLNYSNRMSPTRTSVFTLCTWLVSLFLASLPLVGWGKYGYQSAKVSCTVVWSDTMNQGYTKLYSSLTLFIPLLVMLYAYYHIVKAARRQARVGQLAVLPASIMGPQTNRSSIASNSSAFSGSKALRTTFLVLGTVIFCWLPYVIAILLESEKVHVRYGLQTAFVMVSYSSNLFYPVIYGFHIKAIRRNIKRLLASLFCGNQNRVRPMSDTGFVIPSQVCTRNRSASQGSVNSFDMAWSPRRESESMWSLPAIKEEIENVANVTKSTDLTTDGEVCNLPGSCV